MHIASKLLAVLTVGAVTVGGGQAAVVAEPVVDTAADTAEHAGSVSTVTLVTGDRVRVVARPGRAPSVTVEAAEERSPAVTFSMQTHGGDITVVPSDAWPLVRTGRLDQALFDIDRLIAEGFDDSSRSTTPLIVTYHGRSTVQDRARAATEEGTQDEQPLLSISGAALAEKKSKARLFWMSVTEPLAEDAPTSRVFDAGIDRIWLDVSVRASLDPRVPQIGAPVRRAGHHLV